MKNRIILSCIAIFGIIPSIYAGGQLKSSTQNGEYRKDEWVHDDGHKTIVMRDRDDRVVSVLTISEDGKLLNIQP